MLIGKSNLALSATHELQTSSLTQLRVDEGPPQAGSFGRLLERQLQATPAELLALDAPANADQAAAQRSNGAFQAIMELLFGLPHTPSATPLLDAATPAATASDATAVQDFSPGDARSLRLVQTSSSERCTFAASGNVCLADGSQRQFNVGYQMERSEQTTDLRIGGAFRDPLVVDMGAPDNTLGNVAFDLDSDGQKENVRLPAGGSSAVLFDDRNHNGIADNGSELFGPQSGNGFADLAQLDRDGNGWIDEGDAAFADLKLWHLDSDGKSSVESLAAAGIGALATASAATPFTLKENGTEVGQMRASSVWLGEHSGAGTVRQIDVASVPSPAPDQRA